jgi:hypothetical protein
MLEQAPGGDNPKKSEHTVPPGRRMTEHGVLRVFRDADF